MRRRQKPISVCPRLVYHMEEKEGKLEPTTRQFRISSIVSKFEHHSPGSIKIRKGSETQHANEDIKLALLITVFALDPRPPNLPPETRPTKKKKKTKREYLE
ncbi:hypothetical protein RIF29_25115 [Crotalaria pallida]|uniref:Uncharacterized protein n=1 Tax=Crotalaria pallida TaxID=3830 RepID=A0AAN9HZ06_CROPI